MGQNSNRTSRRKSRQRAVQILYQVDVRSLPPFEAIASFYDSLYDSEEGGEPPGHDAFMEELVRGTFDQRPVLDEHIQKHAAHWKVERMSAVDRNVLRLAAYEMLFFHTPPAVAIDEAIEIARRFSGDESVGFINGVLDALRKDLPAAASLADTKGGEDAV